MSQLTWAEIPTLADASRPDAEPSSLAQSVRREFSARVASRRTLFRVSFTALALMSLNFVSWFGPGAKKAFAWGSCTTEFLGAQTGCVPPYPAGDPYTPNYPNSGYTPSSGACWGGSIGNRYCNSSGWHRRDTVIDGSERYEYKRRCGTHLACGTPTDGYRNAWRWKKDGNVYRCSDGHTFFYLNGHLLDDWLSICQERVA